MTAPLPRLSLRLRVTLWFVTLAWLLLGGFGLALHVRVRQARLRAQDDALREQAQALAQLVEPDEGWAAVPWGDRLPEDPAQPLLGYEVYTLPERALAVRSRSLGEQAVPLPPSTPPLTVAAPERSWFPVELGWRTHDARLGERLTRVRESVFALPDFSCYFDEDEEKSDDKSLRSEPDSKAEEQTEEETPPLGPRILVVVVEDESQVEAELAAQRTAMLLLAPLVGLLSVGAGAFLAQRIVRPLQAITRAAAAQQVAGPPPSVPSTGRGDEIDQLAWTLEDAFRRLRAALEQEARFTADASHELRTPLAVITSEAEVTLKKERAPDEYKAALAATLTAARRMGATLEGLLLLARAEAGTLDTQAEPIDLLEVAEEVARDLAAPAAAAGLELRLAEVDEAARPQARVDAGHLRVALGNLLGNAIRHAGRPGRVTLRVSREGDAALIAVEDQGVGLPADALPRAFERFWRADPSRTRTGPGAGAGLGLSIVRAIARAYGGEATLESAPGAGTTARLRFPCAS